MIRRKKNALWEFMVLPIDTPAWFFIDLLVRPPLTLSVVFGAGTYTPQTHKHTARTHESFFLFLLFIFSHLSCMALFRNVYPVAKRHGEHGEANMASEHGTAWRGTKRSTPRSDTAYSTNLEALSPSTFPLHSHR